MKKNSTKEKTDWLQWILNEQIVEKYITKYLHGRSQYVKQEAYQIVWCHLVESNWEKSDDPKSYLMRIVRNQLFSHSSELYYTIIKPLSIEIPKENFYNNADQEDVEADIDER